VSWLKQKKIKGIISHNKILPDDFTLLPVRFVLAQRNKTRKTQPNK
jgi:hypothetical protein